MRLPIWLQGFRVRAQTASVLSQIEAVLSQIEAASVRRTYQVYNITNSSYSQLAANLATHAFEFCAALWRITIQLGDREYIDNDHYSPVWLCKYLEA